jgi:hypothetical protein
MNTTLQSPPARTAGPKSASSVTPAPGTPIENPKATFRAPNWLQLLIIVGLMGSAVFVAIQGRYLWCSLLAVAGVAFGASFILRRMVGDEYDRS